MFPTYESLSLILLSSFLSFVDPERTEECIGFATMCGFIYFPSPNIFFYRKSRFDHITLKIAFL